MGSRRHCPWVLFGTANCFGGTPTDGSVMRYVAALLLELNTGCICRFPYGQTAVGRLAHLNSLEPRPNPSCVANTIQPTDAAPMYICIQDERQMALCSPPRTLGTKHVRMRDNNSSPHPAETSAASPIQADPSLLTPNRRESDAEYPPWYSLPPSTTSFQSADKSWFSRFKPPQLRPLFRGFERPSFSHIVVLTVLCLITYPVFYILTLVARDKSLFVVRLIVSVWCSGAGFAFGYILLAIGTQHLEAASEFMFVGCWDFLRLHFKQLGPR